MCIGTLILAKFSVPYDRLRCLFNKTKRQVDPLMLFICHSGYYSTEQNMNNSATKHRAGEDGQVNQRLSDTIILDAAEDASVEELTLHRAAAVFRNEVLAGVGDENKALEEEISRFGHLRDCVQEVEITFSAVSFRRQYSEEIGRSVNHMIYEKTMSVKKHLHQGSIVHVDDKEWLVIPINNAPAHPIADCGTVGDISGVLAGMPIGSYPFCLDVTDPAKMRVGDDGSVHLALYLSSLFCIGGKLDAPDNVLVECVEREDFMTNMRMPFPIPFFHPDLSLDKGITFTPTSISMLLTKHLKKTLAFVTEVASSAPSDYNEDSVNEDNLRRLVVSALGESEHKQLLSKNLELKCESAALAGIRKLILGFDISHSAGALSASLDEGEVRTPEPTWHVSLDGKDHTSMPVTDMGRIEISFTGALFSVDVSDTLSLVGAVAGGRIQPVVFRLRLCRSIKFILYGEFNLDDFSDGEIADIVEDFHVKLRSVLCENGDDVFPATMKFKIVGIVCDLSLAEIFLEMVGLWEKHEIEAGSEGAMH
jgi:hypothetical protein